MSERKSQLRGSGQSAHQARGQGSMRAIFPGEHAAHHRDLRLHVQALAASTPLPAHRASLPFCKVGSPVTNTGNLEGLPSPTTRPLKMSLAQARKGVKARRRSVQWPTEMRPSGGEVGQRKQARKQKEKEIDQVSFSLSACLPEMLPPTLRPAPPPTFTWQPALLPQEGTGPTIPSPLVLSLFTVPAQHVISPSLNCFLCAEHLGLRTWRTAEGMAAPPWTSSIWPLLDGNWEDGQ